MRALKIARNVLIVVVGLIVFFAAIGLGYTYYVGKYVTEEVAGVEDVPDYEPHDRMFAPPPAPSPDAPIGAAVQALTSPVMPGENASISIRTTPKATCSITVKYGEVASEDSGLVEKIADEYGVVMWTWTVEETVPHGSWPIEMTCVIDDKSAVVVREIVVGPDEED